MSSRQVKLGLIGQDIAHSLSPRLQTHLGEYLGYQVSFDLIDSSPFELVGHLNGSLFHSYHGLNVTTPHKEYIYRQVDQSTKTAQLIGAVNTLRSLNHQLIGHNTDVIGVSHTLKNMSVPLSGGHALIIGVGPASRAAAYALILAGIRRITWHSRKIVKGQECLRWCEQHFPQLHSSWVGIDGQHIRYDHQAESADLLISGAPPLSYESWSQISRRFQPLLNHHFGLKSRGTFLDLNYGSDRTAGSKKYCKVNNLEHVDGAQMLLAQGVASFLWWNQEDGSIELILSQSDLITKTGF